MKNIFRLFMTACATCLCFSHTANAADANNPLADVTALNFQNLYTTKVFGDSETTRNQFAVRYAKPFKLGEHNWIFRASLYLDSFPISNDGTNDTAIGDTDMFAAYLFDTGKPGVSLGLGHLLYCQLLLMTVWVASNFSLG